MTEKTLKENKVIGILGIEAKASNFNGDFTGSPKKHMGEYVGSPFAIKYPIRRQWNSQGKKVLIIKSFNPKGKSEGSIPVRALGDRYEALFGEEITKSSDGKKILSNILSCVDVINFGTAFAVKEANTQITGVVQFNEGINKYDEAETVRDVVSSPFVNSNKKDAKKSTLGQRSIVTEAHYFYNFNVNPFNLLEFTEIGLPGYTQEAYEDFKSGCFNAVTNLNTVAKAGCSNEFAMFVEFKKDTHNIVNNLNYKIIFRLEGGKKVIDLVAIVKDLEDIEKNIVSIELYYNPNDTKVILDSKVLKAKIIERNINRPSKLIIKEEKTK